MKAQVFISHSCKDAEIVDAGPLDQENDPRQRRLKYAKAVRDGIVAGLGDRFEVLLDRTLLDPGDRWRTKLLRWLGSCHGAVVLLSEDSIRSSWVLQEATIATWRKWLKDSFRLIPVFIGDLSPDQIEKAGFGPLQIAEFQAGKLGDGLPLTLANAQQLAAQVVARFADLTPPSADDSEMQRWVEDVAAKLTGMPENILGRARDPLGIEPPEWAHFPDRELTVAHRLLHASLKAAGDALEYIKGGMSESAFAELAAKVLPIWVHPEAASALVSRKAAGPAEAAAGRWFALNTDQPDTARDYAQRAYCCPSWWHNRCVEFNEPLGEGQESEALEALRRKVKTQLRLPDTASMDSFRQLLSRRPFFVVLGDQMVPTPALQSLLANAAELRSVTFLLLAGRAFNRVQPGLANLVRLRPELGDQDENDALADQLFVRNLTT